MKLLVLLAILAVAYLLWRNKRKASLGQPPQGARQAARPGPAPDLPQEMVRCPACGLHLPREDAVADGVGRLFCSPQHRDLPAP